MVRRYRDLVKEIRDRQRFSRIEWTKNVIEALQYTMDQMQNGEGSNDQTELVTYDEWREWQESLAKEFGFSETTDTPVDTTLRNTGWQKITSDEEQRKETARPGRNRSTH